MLGDLPRRPPRSSGDSWPGRRGRPSSRRCSCLPSASASSRAAADRSTPSARPCAADRRRRSRRSRGRSACPRRSSRALAVPAGGAAVVDVAAVVIRHPVEDGAVPVGQAIVVALVGRQAVAVHLRQEAQIIRQGEVPDVAATRPASASARRPSASACPCGRRPRRRAGRRSRRGGCRTSAAGDRLRPSGRPSGTIGSGSGPFFVSGMVLIAAERRLDLAAVVALEGQRRPHALRRRRAAAPGRRRTRCGPRASGPAFVLALQR